MGGYIKALTKSIIIYFLTTSFFVFSMIFLVPLLKDHNFTQINAYLLSAGFALFILFVLALALFKIEAKGASWAGFFKRFRLRRMTRQDALVTAIAIISILILDGILYGLNSLLFKIGLNFDYSSLPGFTGMDGQLHGHYEVLGFYLAYLFFNIFGEELLWRGYLLPIQEKALPKHAWIFNSVFWLIFHFIFAQSIIIMLPLLFILPYAVQKQKNTWIGIIVHTVTGLVGFISIIEGVI